MNHTTRLHTIKLYLHTGLWSAILIGAGAWLTTYLAGTLGDPLSGKGRGASLASDAEVFEGIIALTEKKVVRYIGDWEFAEPHLSGHFHHIGRWYETDRASFCIDCHGPIPHARTVQVRSFLNMHGSFMSCHVCHVRGEDGAPRDRFGWARLADGRLCPTPDLQKGAWGEYGAKIVPLAGGPDDPQPLRLAEEEAFAGEFRKRMNELESSKKVIGNKFIHRRCPEKPVQCKECHTANGALLPLAVLGYPEDRVQFLTSVEVTDLVTRYEQFHLPKLLDPEKK